MGSYVERSGDFGIAWNALAPAPGRALVPWARSDEAGYALGGNRFDLDRWDPAYFERLHRFLRAAAEREHPGGAARLPSPAFDGDIALRITVAG